MGLNWLDRLISIFRPRPGPTPTPTPTPQPPQPPDLARAGAALVAAINAARAGRGLPALKADRRLGGTARAQAAYCATTGRLTHAGPGGSSPWDRIHAAGVPYVGMDAQENGAAWQADAEQVVRDWVGERPPGITGHRDNVYDRRWTHCGGGAAADGDGRIYWFVDFARE